jgi:predicted AlkP superfamily phosphohydrolase/phosphomutase
MSEQISPSPKKRVFIIGLDGASWTGLNPLLEKGLMPHLKSMINKGTSGILESVIPPATAPAWSSFQTGKYPSKHGVVDFFMYKPWSYETEFTTSAHIKGHTLWKLLSDAGKKVIAVNVPMTYPPEKVNGIIIPGFDTPDTSSQSTHPEGILDEIEKKMGAYRRYRLGWNDKIFKEKGLNALIDELISYTETQVESVSFLMQEYGWDVCMYHFQVTDALQHHAWDLVDQGDDAYKDKPAAEKQLVQDFYRRIDDKIGGLVDRAGPDTNIVVLSDHGFQTMRRNFYVNQWLRDKGYIRENRAYFALRVLDNIVAMGKKLHLPVLKDMAYPLRKSPMRNLKKIDFKRSRAYAYSYNTNYCLIVVNKDLEDATEPLRKDLEELIDGGKKIVAAVTPWYDGATEYNFSTDLVVEFSKGYAIMQKISASKHSPFREATEAGAHELEGLFCIAGGNIKKGLTAKARLVDIMPTVLHMTGCSIPDDLDGMVMHEIFETYTGETFATADDTQSARAERGKEDFDKVASRLESLGYI